ncbi:pentapeptide repeat-containing protein [Oceanospirillum sediminis]|uniref:Pentapeptide repeat-containing protein n=1 Tax=Oceanospirillum sediminis TaxID=2760088 RepID=A0A839IWL8_9GAMM|nr:pentapeptide repeat-containing protein [Oceanospirillum sediminis]MBB1488476.1 pentapeptide repeat-containing protein [Oceanospirillum sediminis]
MIKLENVNISGSDFDDVNMADSRFNNTNLSGTTFNNINMENVIFDDVYMGCVEIRNSTLQQMTINGIPVDELIAAWEAQQTK